MQFPALTSSKPTLLKGFEYSDSLSKTTKALSDVQKWLDMDVGALGGQSEDELVNRIAGLKTILFKLDEYALSSPGDPLMFAIQEINLTLCIKGSDLKVEHASKEGGNAVSTEYFVIKNHTFETWKQTIIQKESEARQEYWARYF